MRFVSKLPRRVFYPVFKNKNKNKNNFISENMTMMFGTAFTARDPTNMSLALTMQNTVDSFFLYWNMCN